MGSTPFAWFQWGFLLFLQGFLVAVLFCFLNKEVSHQSLSVSLSSIVIKVCDVTVPMFCNWHFTGKDSGSHWNAFLELLHSIIKAINTSIKVEEYKFPPILEIFSFVFKDCHQFQGDTWCYKTWLQNWQQIIGTEIIYYKRGGVDI